MAEANDEPIQSAEIASAINDLHLNDMEIDATDHSESAQPDDEPLDLTMEKIIDLTGSVLDLRVNKFFN